MEVLLSNHERRTGFAFFQTSTTTFMMSNFQQRTKTAYAGNFEDKMMGVGCVAASASVSLAIMFWAARLLLEKSTLLF